MAQELEIKLDAAPEALRALLKLPWLSAFANGDTVVETLDTVYYDTDKRDLRRAGVSLRIRRAGHDRIQTIKAFGSSAVGRGEWESVLTSDRPDLSHSRGTALEPLARRRLARRLKPVFETSVQRTLMPIHYLGGDLALTLDRGRIKAGRNRLPISEIEIEVKGGDPGVAAAFAERIAQSLPVGYGARSKAERGYALCEGSADEPIGSKAVALDPGMTAAEAFAAIGLACLDHALANDAAVRQGKPEGIHQMRIGLRRLRAAISLFKPILADPQSGRIKFELRWLTDQLGPVRELDVLIAGRVGPLGEAGPIVTEARPLGRRLAADREEALMRLVAAISDGRYRRLGIATALWVTNGAWRGSDDPKCAAARDEPIAEFAARLLQRRRKKISQRLKKLEDIDPRRRHRLRIAVKKLRYATGFFAGLFDGRKRTARRKAFAQALKALQGGLGTLNDIEAHRRLAREIAQPDSGRSDQVPLAFAMGFIQGEEQAQIAACLETAERGRRRLARAGRFWS